MVDPTAFAGLPTDSLYKFWALFGMALLFLPIFEGLFIQKDRRYQLYEFERDLAIAKARLDHTQGVQARKIAMARVTCASAKLKHLRWTLERHRKMKKVIFIVASLLYFTGFGGWGWFLQRHIDKAYKAQAAEAEATLKRLEGESKQ